MAFSRQKAQRKLNEWRAHRRGPDADAHAADILYVVIVRTIRILDDVRFGTRGIFNDELALQMRPTDS